MDKDVLPIYQCNSGMRLYQDVVNTYGTKIAPKGSILNDNIIAKLKLNGIEYLSVYSDINRMYIQNYKKIFTGAYSECISKVKTFLKVIGNGDNIYLDVVCETGNHLLDITKYASAFEVFKYLNEIKEADDYTYHHCINVSLISMIIGRWLKFDEEKLRNLTYSGLLHDIGKIKVPKEILNKAGKLSENEFEEIKKHTTYGYNIVKNARKLPECVAMGVLTHHERINGTGYPEGLMDDQIHEFGKVIAIADIYDAMTSNRVYHSAENPFKVFGMLQNKNLGLIDTEILLTFLSHVSNYYIGDKVVLSNGKEGRVVFINHKDISSPLVQTAEGIIDLSREKDIFIKTMGCVG